MAKLPDYTALGAPAAPQPQLGVVSDRAGTAEDSSTGDAFRKVGADLQGVSNELWQFKEKTDTIRVEDAWNQYKNAATDLTAGPDGLLKTQGADAVNGNLLGKSSAALTDARSKIADSLTDDQRRRFDERADVTDLETKKQVLGHLAQQQIEYGKTVFQGSEAAAKAQIAAAPTDPGVFRGARETLMAQADQYLKQNGVADKATGDALKAKLTDSLWVTRINSLLYSQPALADAMFRANEKEIKDPELRLLMQNKTREVALTVVAGNEADSIMNDTRMELAAPRPAPGQVEVSQKTPAAGDDMRVSPQVQFKRDQDRLRILEQELKDDPTDAALQREIAGARANVQRQQAGLQRVSDSSVPAPLQENTNGLPNSRDIAAQLPIMMAKVTARADALYGKDQGNPDRAAFIKRLTGELQSRVSQEVQQLNAVQREAQGTLLDAVTGVGAPAAGGGLMNVGGQPAAPVKITSMAQVMANPTLARAYQMMDVQAKIGVQNLIERNLKTDEAGDPRFERQIFDRINLPPGDPNKISFYQQITDPSIANRLSMEQLKRLRTEIDRDATPGGRTYNQMRKAADSDAALYFKTNVMFTAQPERQISATMKWNEDAGRKIDEYVAAGKDVRTLFMQDSKDSIVSPAYLQSYVNSTPAQGLAEGAAAVKAGAQPVNVARAPDTIKTPADAEAWIKTLPPDATMFMDSKGQMRMIPGRGQGPAQATPGADSTMNATGALVNPPETPVTVPRLVVPSTPKERALERQRLGQIEKADANVRLAEGVIKGAKAVKGVQEAASTGVANALEAVNPGEVVRTVRSFREMVKMGTFTPASEGLILDAMDSGMLNPAEERTARAMLRQLASKRK